VRKWNLEVTRIMRYAPNTPEAFGGFIKAEIANWTPVVKASGARAD
jgi:hypothetical protein